MGFPDPQFGVPLSIDDIPNELTFYPIYGVTPSNQYIPISIDGTGRINTNAIVTVEDLGEIDRSPFIYGTSYQQVIGGVYQDASPTLSAGQQGAVRLTQNRAFHTNLRYSDGTEILPATEATSASINAGIQTLNSLVPSQYDYIDLQYTGNNLTQAQFYLGGPGGTLVSTLTLTYSGPNLTSVQKS